MRRPVPLLVTALIAIVAGALMVLVGLGARGEVGRLAADSVLAIGVLLLVGGMQMQRMKRSAGPVFELAAVVALVASVVAGQLPHHFMGIATLAFWGWLYQKWLAQYIARSTTAAAGSATAAAKDNGAASTSAR
jgi:hypothetical protein